MNSRIKIHEKNNVITALVNLQVDEEVKWNGDNFRIRENNPVKNKFFEKDFAAGEEVDMHGVLVGKTQMPVSAGTLMTTENLKHAARQYAYRSVQYQWVPPDVLKFIHRTFRGYKRSDGKAGTANYWLFIPTVFCENRNVDV